MKADIVSAEEWAKARAAGSEPLITDEKLAGLAESGRALVKIAAALKRVPVERRLRVWKAVCVLYGFDV
jgi:hypothetical protein